MRRRINYRENNSGVNASVTVEVEDEDMTHEELMEESKKLFKDAQDYASLHDKKKRL